MIQGVASTNHWRMTVDPSTPDCAEQESTRGQNPTTFRERVHDGTTTDLYVFHVKPGCMLLTWI